jgi:hypothetical protein
MTSNAEVVVIASNPHQGGGKYVTVGIGPGRAPWQCIGFHNGSTAEGKKLMSRRNQRCTYCELALRWRRSWVLLSSPFFSLRRYYTLC